MLQACLEKQRNMRKPCIIVHGGMDDAEHPPLLIEREVACRKAACRGYKVLKNGGSSADAAEAAIRWLEDDELFNAGYGSVLNQFCVAQMDASMMDGKSQTIGSVTAVSDVDHPVSLAKYAMKHYPNSILCGGAAVKLAGKLNDVLVTSKGNMVSPAAYANCVHGAEEGFLGVKLPYIFEYDGTQTIFEHDIYRMKGTVGCVAWDGRVMVSASSTGGLNRKRPGRVGDSSLLGCGLYAGATFGCSLSGHGENVIRMGLARRIHERAMEKDACLVDVLCSSLKEMEECTGQKAGGIALMKDGTWASIHLGTAMPFAYIREDEITCGSGCSPKEESSESSECHGESSATSISCASSTGVAEPKN